MKERFAHFLILLACACAGCATKTRSVSFSGFTPVKARGPGEYMFVEGQHAWYSALQFEQIAENYARQRRIAFDFTNAQKAIWVYTDGFPILATATFSHGTGGPYFRVDIDRSGKPMRYRAGVWTCGAKPGK